MQKILTFLGLFLVSFSFGYAESRVIKGLVIDQEGLPVEGVEIIAWKNQIMPFKLPRIVAETKTNNEGKFELKIKEKISFLTADTYEKNPENNLHKTIKSKKRFSEDFIQEFGPYTDSRRNDEGTEHAGTQYVWLTLNDKISLNLTDNKKVASIHFIRNGYKHPLEIHDIERITKERLPFLRYLELYFGIVTIPLSFTLYNSSKTLYVRYTWEEEIRESNLIIYVNDLE